MNHQWTGDRVLQLRLQLGVNQRDFAVLLGGSPRQATVSDWERGARTPSPIYHARLSELETEAEQMEVRT